MLLLKMLAGLLGSGGIAAAAYRRRSLGPGGAWAAVVVGTTLAALQGPAWIAAMIAFFVSSSVWSKLGKRSKQSAEEGYEKGDRRDAGQVAANGGAAVAIAIAASLVPHEAWSFAYVGAMAAVTADTWATEIGSRSRRKPRSIVTWRTVEPGASGGVTPLGLGASTAGGLFIAAVFGALSAPWSAAPAEQWIGTFAAGVCGGVIGSLADSWIGAVWQRMNRCDVCGKEVEAGIHCGMPTRYVRGLRFMNNDAVNTICSVVGAAAGGAVAWCLL